MDSVNRMRVVNKPPSWGEMIKLRYQGTTPHVEVNYGGYPNLQLHVIAPLAYDRHAAGPTTYGVLID